MSQRDGVPCGSQHVLTTTRVAPVVKCPSASAHKAAVKRKNPNAAPTKRVKKMALTLVEQIMKIMFSSPMASGK